MNKLTGVILLLLFLFPQGGWADDLSARGIMDKVFYRDDGEDSYFKVEMVLIDKRGSERRRILETRSKDYGELIKTFLEFRSPADIEGTRFLSWENSAKDDTQYLYLPALGKIRRIVTSQKNLRFVNTDFTYEDMERRRPDKDEHKLISEEKYNGYDCYVIESIPKEKTSQYSKRVSRVGKESLVILSTDFYNKKDEKNKEFRVKQLEKKDNIWTAMDTEMRDLKEEHRTLMRTEEVKYNQRAEDEIFTLQNLENY